MLQQNDEFLKRLLATFRVEADEHLNAMSAGLIALGHAAAGEPQSKIIETIFREAHSLKGAARAVKSSEIESVCQSLEGVFAALKSRQLDVSPPLLDLMLEAIDVLGKLLMVEGVAASDAGKSSVAILTRRLNGALQQRFNRDRQIADQISGPSTRSANEGEQVADCPANHASEAIPAMDMPAPLSSAVAGSGTIRVFTHKLDAVMRQVEELLSPQLAAAQRACELRELAASMLTWKKQRARMRPALRLIERYVEGAGTVSAKVPLQQLPKLLEYLDSEHLFMKTLEERLRRLSKFAAHDRRMLAGMSDSLLHDVKEMHLQPFSALLEIFPRFTRELAREQGKQVELVIQGDDIEIDRSTLEAMKDPLMHLLRNCIDHGIEQPAVRRDKGLPEHGSITVAIAQKDGGKIEILLADDGTGIDAGRVLTAARKLGLVAASEVGPSGEQEAHELIFRSGISTSQMITDISGRGLGLAIVREKVERLGGVVALESRYGVKNSGTSFRITLPLMLSTFRGVLVRSCGQLFVLPLHHVERVARVACKEVRTVENRAAISLGGQAVALVRLGDVLELPERSEQTAPAYIQAVILGLDSARIAFEVDEILGEQEVLVKTLGTQLVRVRNVIGASVLGTGQVVAVLNVPDLLKSATKRAASPRVVAKTQEVAGKRSILVVEDSITSRALLKNILESAGYLVTTAVDGVDGYTLLKSSTFDLIVSDVEMPRMDGFDLTARVRADKQLSELPVVLVTALGSREHRERGIDVGANAYIVKSNFDQSNLLAVVGQLI